MKDIRCQRCNHLLMKAELNDGKIEVKCSKCKSFTTYTATGAAHKPTSEDKRQDRNTSESGKPI